MNQGWNEGGRREQGGSGAPDWRVYPRRYIIADLSIDRTEDGRRREKEDALEKLVIVETLYGSARIFLGVIKFIFDKLVPMFIGLTLTILFFRMFTLILSPKAIPGGRLILELDFSSILRIIMDQISILMKDFGDLVSSNGLSIVNFTLPKETSRILLRPDWVSLIGSTSNLPTLWLELIISITILLIVRSIFNTLFDERSSRRLDILLFPRSIPKASRIGNLLKTLTDLRWIVILLLASLFVWTAILYTNPFSIFMFQKLGVLGLLLISISTAALSILPIFIVIYLLMRNVLVFRREGLTLAKLEEQLADEESDPEGSSRTLIKKRLSLDDLLSMMADLLSKDVRVEGKSPDNLYVRFFGSLARKASEVSGGLFRRGGLTFGHQTFLSIVTMAYVLVYIYWLNMTAGAEILSKTFVLFVSSIMLLPFLPIIYKAVMLPIPKHLPEVSGRDFGDRLSKGTLYFLYALSPAVIINGYLAFLLRGNHAFEFFLPIVNLAIFYWINRELEELPEEVMERRETMVHLARMYLVTLWAFFIFDVIRPILSCIWYLAASILIGVGGDSKVYERVTEFVFRHAVTEQLVLLALLMILVLIVYVYIDKYYRLLIIEPIFASLAALVMVSLNQRYPLNGGILPFLDPTLLLPFFFILLPLYFLEDGRSGGDGIIGPQTPWVSHYLRRTAFMLVSFLILITSDDWIRAVLSGLLAYNPPRLISVWAAYIVFLVVVGYRLAEEVIKRERPRYSKREGRYILILLAEVYGFILSPPAIDPTVLIDPRITIRHQNVSTRVDPECEYH